MNKAQEIQNEIYRKMSADKKIKIVDDFYRFSQKLQSLTLNNEDDNSKISQSNKFHFKQT